MLFHGTAFLAFFLGVLVVYHGVLRGWSTRKRFLLAASWLFYASWSPRFLLLLVATTWIDFHLARAIYRARHASPEGAVPRPRLARGLLVGSLALNVGVLAFFKYGAFFWESAAALAPLPPAPAWLRVAVPLGISFYTLHAISYVVDTWRGVRPPSERFSDYALYVAFFPQLIAGPITRWGYFGPQLERPRRIGMRAVETGIFLFAVGCVKKVVLADSLGAFVDGVYAAPVDASSFESLTAIYAYAFQIYFDFSGYTDMARGLAVLLGFRLPENFRHPYLAASPNEFWRRWHITLSSWLRDYLLIPILRALDRRRGATTANAVVATMTTMLLSGLWHGASWGFVAWGAWHGAWLSLHRIWTRLPGPRALLPAWGASASRRAADAARAGLRASGPRTPLWFRRVVAFHVVALGLVLFRAPTLAIAFEVVRALAAGRPNAQPFPIAAVAIVALGLATHLASLRVDLGSLWRRAPRTARGAACGVASLIVWACSAQATRFIYFGF